ncbi:MAG: hypothetical protein LUC16_04020 [Coprobacillus sp.]|nr:hypothetical protein [Coprobacillus sp.]
MADITRQPGETAFDYHKRLVLDKIVNRTLGDVDYTELAKIVYGKELSSDDARKRMYGSAATLQLLESEMSRCVANRILALSDFHVPFNLDVGIFKQYANRIDTLVLNGDLEDCQSISKFTKLYRLDLVE